MKHGHIIVIGGTKGSGRALVRLFLQKQCMVSLLGRQPSPEVKQQKERLFFYPVDLCDLPAVQSALEKCVEEHGKITHLVFYQRYRGKTDDWQGEFQVSLTATKAIIEHCAQNFDGAGENSIVVINSVANRLIHDEQPLSYHMAKAALIQMVRYYAVILGTKGIRVNSVSPATVVKEESSQSYAENKKLRELYDAITPLRRMGTSEDVANAVEFLCSQKASFITGQEILVDGGLSLVAQTSLSRRLAGLNELKITR